MQRGRISRLLLTCVRDSLGGKKKLPSRIFTAPLLQQMLTAGHMAYSHRQCFFQVLGKALCFRR